MPGYFFTLGGNEGGSFVWPLWCIHFETLTFKLPLGSQRFVYACSQAFEHGGTSHSYQAIFSYILLFHRWNLSRICLWGRSRALHILFWQEFTALILAILASAPRWVSVNRTLQQPRHAMGFLFSQFHSITPFCTRKAPAEQSASAWSVCYNAYS